MASATETGYRARIIASKACDLCRARKSQCVFESDKSTHCKRCTRQGVECTFLRGHKLRGPRSHRQPDEYQLPLSKVEIEHLCSIDLLHLLFRGFDEFVYPLFPLVDSATCHELLQDGAYNADPVFLRRCFSLCAITVASVPNKESEYCQGRYPTCYKFVNRACDLVLMSRLTTQPGWQDNPTLETAIDSLMLSIASHYVGCTRRGWALANEAVLVIRDLELQHRGGLAKINTMEATLCKRAFWILHLTQIQDSLISHIPHMLPGFPPPNTDWQAMDISREPDIPVDSQHASTSFRASLTAATGLAHMTKVIQCMREILASESYRPCLTTLSQHFTPLALPQIRLDFLQGSEKPSYNRCLMVAREISARLDGATEGLPRHQSYEPTSDGIEMTIATVRILALYFTNALIDAIFASSTTYCEEVLPSTTETHSHGRSPCGLDDKIELWKIRESISQRLLDILQETSPEILELNGFSLIHQIRKIATSLLDCGEDPELAPILGGQPQEYLAQFTRILANLDLNAATSAMLHKRFSYD